MVEQLLIAPVPNIFSWASFDYAFSWDIGLENPHPWGESRLQGVANSSEELLLAIDPSKTLTQAVLSSIEPQLIDELKIKEIDWQKYAVMFYLGNPNRFGGDIRLDLWRSNDENISAQWTFKEDGSLKTWFMGAAALVERTNDHVTFKKFRHISKHLSVNLWE